MRLILSTIFIFIIIWQVVHAINLKLDPHLEVIKNENGVITLGLKPEAKPQTQPKPLQWQQFFGLMPSKSFTQIPNLLFKPEVESKQMIEPNGKQVNELPVVPPAVQESDRVQKSGNTGTKGTESSVMPNISNNKDQNSLVIPKTDKNAIQMAGKIPVTIMENNVMSIAGNDGIQTSEKAQAQKSTNGNERGNDGTAFAAEKQAKIMDDEIPKAENDESKEMGNNANPGMSNNDNQGMESSANQEIPVSVPISINNVLSNNDNQGMENNADQEIPVSVPIPINNGLSNVGNQDMPIHNQISMPKNTIQISPLMQLLSTSLIPSLASKSSAESHSFEKSESSLNTQQSIQPQLALETLRSPLTQTQSMVPSTGNRHLIDIPKIETPPIYEPVFQSSIRTEQLPMLQSQLQSKPDSVPVLFESILKSNSISKQESNLNSLTLTKTKFPLETQIPSVMQMQPKINDNKNKFAVNSIITPASVIKPIFPLTLKVISKLRQLICYGVTRNEILNGNGSFNNGLSKLCDQNLPAPKVASQVNLIRSLLSRLQKFE